jgi:hypothetical protein
MRDDDRSPPIVRVARFLDITWKRALARWDGLLAEKRDHDRFLAERDPGRLALGRAAVQ